jgi:DNA repair photolyase
MTFRRWETVPLRTEDGTDAEAVAPVIVSASRRTDLPAFHGKWFFDRLQAGHVTWVNPFSGTAQYVSFAKARAVVFWTKNPKPMLDRLDELDQRGIGYYFQFTLNGYEVEGLEPGVPPLAERVGTFAELARRIGKEKVVWRYDPLLLADGLSPDRLVERVVRVGEAVRDSTEKLVIAFADIERYAKVRSRLRKLGKGCRELTPEEMRDFAERLTEAVRGWGLQIATCAEAIDLAAYGIARNKCIDDALLERLFPHDAELMGFLGPREGRHGLKDKGQRKECGCIVSKDIGSYDTCPHLCRYCYANSSESAAMAVRSRLLIQ